MLKIEEHDTNRVTWVNLNRMESFQVDEEGIRFWIKRTEKLKKALNFSYMPEKDNSKELMAFLNLLSNVMIQRHVKQNQITNSRGNLEITVDGKKSYLGLVITTSMHQVDIDQIYDCTCTESEEGKITKFEIPLKDVAVVQVTEMVEENARYVTILTDKAFSITVILEDGEDLNKVIKGLDAERMEPVYGETKDNL